MVESGRFMIFFGYYEHTLDDKGRLVIPSKMRSQLSNVVYIMKGYDGALSIYHESTFAKLAAKVEEESFTRKSARDFIRISLSSTQEMEIDKQGRVQIPSLLLNKYNIGKEVVVIGAGDHIEVWNKAKYEEYEEAADKDYEINAEKLYDNK